MEPMRPEEGAATIGRHFGLVVTGPVTLADSNNVVVWLRPSLVVAKVGTGHHRCLRLELDVARYLVAQGAPVIAPARELPQDVHHLAGFDMTFWQYQRGERAEDIAPGKLGAPLFHLHQVLARYPGPLPGYEEELTRVRRVLNDRGRSPALGDTDRGVLLRALDRFSAELASWYTDRHSLHGAPHSANQLIVGGARPTFHRLRDSVPRTDRMGLSPRRLRSCRNLPGRF